MTFYAVADTRGHHGRIWFWTDSLSTQRQASLDNLVEFVRVMPGYVGLSRAQQLKKARRWGLRVVKVRLEVVA